VGEAMGDLFEFIKSIGKCPGIEYLFLSSLIASL
jgi:hypothetical protein